MSYSLGWTLSVLYHRPARLARFVKQNTFHLPTCYSRILSFLANQEAVPFPATSTLASFRFSSSIIDCSPVISPRLWNGIHRPKLIVSLLPLLHLRPPSLGRIDDRTPCSKIRYVLGQVEPRKRKQLYVKPFRVVLRWSNSSGRMYPNARARAVRL